MFKKHLSLFLGLFIVLFIAISGCKSSFEKLKTSNDNNKKYTEAVKLYNKKEYGKALELFNDIAPKYRGSSSATDLFYYQAMANYKLKDYVSAAYLFKQFADTFPSDAKAEECRFLHAYCYYLEAPDFSLDQENTEKAIERMQLFINFHPKSERVAEANKLIQIMHEKLEDKSYANSKLHLDIGNYQAAVISFNNTLRDYPDTKYAEEIEYLIAKSQYEYAKRSLETKQVERHEQAITYANEFTEKYPESAYLKSVATLKKDSQQGVVKTKLILTEAEAELKAFKNENKKDSTQVKPSSK